MAAMSEPPDRGGQAHGGPGGPGGQGDDRNKDKVSYSERVKSNIKYDQRLKRNVLEITLEKTDNEATFDVDQDDTARICKTLGIDIAAQVEGYNIHFKGKVSVICVWMAAGINLEKYCKDVSIKVGDGIVTGMIRPAGKKDVTVSIVGLDFNTPHPFVIEYLNKFGTVLSNTVIYSKYDSGPFGGKFNGERKYQVDFSKSKIQMGNYHLIDGNKVRVFYRGNGKTCARCHKLARECPGGALAKNCNIAGGNRVLLSEHMKKLWSIVGFTPVSFELDDDEKMEDDIKQAEKDAPVKEVERFPSNMLTQEPTERDVEKFDGVTIRNIPRTVEDKDILEFLMNHGMPHDQGIENVRINRREKNTWVLIEGLSSPEVQTMFSSIHFHVTNHKFFDAPLFCKPLRNISPLKPEKPIATDASSNKVAVVAIDVANTSSKAVVAEDDVTTKVVVAIDDANTSSKAVVAEDDVTAEVAPDVAASENNEDQAASKNLIPGLPEELRLKPKKKRAKRKKKNQDEEDQENKMARDYFLKSPGGTEKEPMFEDFQFSDYDTDSDDDKFEDSREAFSDSGDHEVSQSEQNVDFLTPVNLKSTFARTLQAKSSTPSTSRSRSTSTPVTVKRPAPSPATSTKTKKPRPQSKLPKKQ